VGEAGVARVTGMILFNMIFSGKIWNL
jgi:hypothetical protein